MHQCQCTEREVIKSNRPAYIEIAIARTSSLIPGPKASPTAENAAKAERMRLIRSAGESFATARHQ